MSTLSYGGRLIYRVMDEHGPIEVVEAHGVRSLHFGSFARQSAIDLEASDRIELAYLRSMLSPLLFVSHPQRVLLLGLGGGTLARFFLHHFSEACIEAVELRAAVLDVARTHFMLELRPPLNVHVMDAHHYLERHLDQKAPTYDLVLVDLFDAEGPSVVLDESEFLVRLSQVLSPKGGLALNLWSGEDASWRRVQAQMREIFKGPMAGLPVPGRGNRICLALGEAHGPMSQKALLREARTLECRYGIEFVRFLERLEFSLNPKAR